MAPLALALPTALVLHMAPQCSLRPFARAPSTKSRPRSAHCEYAKASLIQAPIRRSNSFSLTPDVFRPAVMSQHRNAINISIKLSDHPVLQRCVDDKSYRVMVFCAGDPSGVQDIAFPHQSELKVNGGDIKANLRGLKNKPGSTRPVDITHALRLKPQYINNVEFTYALTNKVSRRQDTVPSLPPSSSLPQATLHHVATTSLSLTRDGRNSISSPTSAKPLPFLSWSRLFPLVVAFQRSWS